MNDATGDVKSSMLDLSAIDFIQLEALPDSVVTRFLYHIRDEIERPEEAVAGFSSSL